jgi:ribonucleoside-diphosphate reductase alpha chain
VKYKKLVGGGMLKIVNQTVPEALSRLGYSAEQVKAVVEFIDENETIEGAPFLKDEHLAVFDCAFKPVNGSRSIHWMGHLKMMAAVQPFISGAISKTVNMPEECTVEDIMTAYTEAWKQGLKALAIYRDGSKRSQPLNTSLDKLKDTSGKSSAASAGGTGSAQAEIPRLVRRRLADERKAITHKFSIAGHEGYLTVGLYEDGQPGEIFVTMAKEGSVVSGLVDSIATLTSISLQYGVPLEVLCNKFVHTRFEPSGFTNNPQIPIAKSIMDYMFRWLQLRFLGGNQAEAAKVETIQDSPSTGLDTAMDEKKAAVTPKPVGKATTHEHVVFQQQADAPPCHECGSIMVRSGACYKCSNCGSTSGCS